MTIAVYLGKTEDTAQWIDLLATLLPEHAVEDMGCTADRNAIKYAVVWAPPAGAIATFPNLKAVVSISAGVDHVLRDPELPRHLPVLRTVGPDMMQRMREYVALHVMSHHRELMTTDVNQRRRIWKQVATPLATQRRVGVMGLGLIARSCAQTLASLGFQTAGWSRSGCVVDGVTVYRGVEELDNFLSRTDILVCLLPLTPETRDILNADRMTRLPQGARIINVGRGGLLVDEELLTLLDSGQIGGATLDVFRTEPLPEDHPFWTHPKIRVTPHIAAMYDARSSAAMVADSIRRFEATGTCDTVALPVQGY